MRLRLIICLTLVMCLADLSVMADEKGSVSKQSKAAKSSIANKKGHYEVMWASDAALCNKIKNYADAKRDDYVPTDMNFGNLQWQELDDPTRQSIDTILAGETSPRTIFRTVLPRRTGLEWDYSLKIFPLIVDADALKRDPVSFARKHEWSFNPDDAELKGLQASNPKKKSRWCSKLKDNEWELGCKGMNIRWRFSFFDLIEIDGKVFITAATEKYMDDRLPVVILVGRYVAPPKTTNPVRAYGTTGTMSQLEHLCYLIKEE